MKVAIVGSRDYPHMEKVRAYVTSLARWDSATVIVSGGARGVDQVAETSARANGLAVESFPADWSTGRGAGMDRNTKIVDAADRVVAFWDEQSRGTHDTITKALKAGKLHMVRGRRGQLMDKVPELPTRKG